MLKCNQLACLNAILSLSLLNDFDTYLQVGTGVLDLSPLLRQGRPFAEQLLEVPLMMMDALGLGTGGKQVCGSSQGLPSVAAQRLRSWNAAPNQPRQA